MRITFTGRQVELAPAQLKKIEARFGKVSKLLDGKNERGAHVVLAHERHLHKAEVTVNYRDHRLVGIASNVDLSIAIHSAIERLEKQAIKVRSKRRDTARTPRNTGQPASSAPAQAEGVKQVFRVNHYARRKPMTLDEAILEMESSKRDYLVYRDTQTDRMSVLLRRRDENFDLIES